MKKIFLLLIFFFSCISYISGSESRVSILVINSYHPQYNWTDGVVRGIKSQFEHLDSEQLNIEYMDTKKREGDRLYLKSLYEFYKYKYSGFNFSVIIILDDNGLDFILKYRDQLFPDVPVVFGGINNFDPALKKHHGFMTGLIEGESIRKNINLILSVHPDIGKLVFLTDKFSFGQKLSRTAAKIMQQDEFSGLKYEIWDDFSFISLLDRMSKEDDRTVFFLLPVHKDNEGRYFSYSKDLPVVSKYSRCPVYGMWNILLGKGVVGGQMNDAFVHGRTVAQMAKLVISGTKTSDIPFVRESNYTPQFDYNLLKRFSIDPEKLPPGSRIINKESGLYEKYKYWIWGIVVFFIIETTMIFFLIINSIRIRQIHRKLKRKLEQLSITLESSAVNLWIFNNREKCITHVASDSREDSDNVTVAFDSWLEIIHPEDKKKFDCLMQRYPGCKEDKFEIEFRKRVNEKWKWFVLRGKILEWGTDDIPVIASGTSMDISELKKQDLLLKQAQKMESIGNLAGGIAHDFNNVLNGISGSNSIMKLKIRDYKELIPDYGSIEEYTDTIGDLVYKASDIIKRLLSLSKKSEFDPKKFDLNEAVKSVMKICKHSFDKSVEIKTVFSDTPAEISGDSGQVEQVLLNLCVNASHAMTIQQTKKSAGGVLSLKIERVSADIMFRALHSNAGNSDYWKITVSDTGVGMDSEILSRIFDPFFTTKSEKGTGLGLSMVYKIIKDHEGFIDVSSEPDKGTDFKLFFPVSE